MRLPLIVPWLLLVPAAARADAAPSPEEAAGSEGFRFHGGGGLFVLPTYFDLGAIDPGHVGVTIGGGGYLFLWEDRFRLGGMGAEAFFGDEGDWYYRMNFGGLFADWVFHPADWCELWLGAVLGFGAGRLEIATGLPPPSGAPGDAVVERKKSGFLVLVAPTAGVGFIPLRFLKLSLWAWFDYAHWLPDPGLGGSVGLSVFFGSFR